VRPSSRGIAALFLVLTTIIAFSGIVYAMWSENLYINVEVDTGYVDADFDQAVCNDPPSTFSLDPSECGCWNYNTMTWSGSRYDKDVANCTVSGVGTKTLTVSIKNAYPCYYSSVAFNITNTGTIPVKVKSIRLIEISNKTHVWIAGVNFTAEDLTPCTTYYIDADAGTVSTTLTSGVDFSIHLSTPLNLYVQIDPDQELSGDLCVHIEQDAAESSSYDFKIEIVVAQWNEVSPPK